MKTLLTLLPFLLPGLACARAGGDAETRAVPMQPALLLEGVEVRIAGDGSEPQVQEHGVPGVVAPPQVAPVRMSSAGAPALEIASERATWDFRAHKVVFEGKINARRGSFDLRCDRLEVNWKGADRVDTALASGHVQLSRASLRAQGQNALLLAESGRVELTGAPSISDGAQSMSGERIVLWLDDERVECESCRLQIQGEAIRPLVPVER